MVAECFIQRLFPFIMRSEPVSLQPVHSRSRETLENNKGYILIRKCYCRLVLEADFETSGAVSPDMPLHYFLPTSSSFEHVNPSVLGIHILDH